MLTRFECKLDRLTRQTRCPSCGAARDTLIDDEPSSPEEDKVAAYYTCVSDTQSIIAIDRYDSIVCRQACNEVTVAEVGMMDADANSVFDSQE
jgi:hypothetical protein